MMHMNFSIQLRDRRRAAGLTQAALADRSGTGRVTIARLEAGASQDFRLGTLVRLCDALGLELAAIAPGALQAAETRLARAHEHARRLDARRRHATLAARLLAAPAREAAALIARARANVDRWERDGLCSTHYISRWRTMLAGPRRRVARALVGDGAWTDALLQNTPWTFALAPAAA
jgi:transcriptional regulator with XRE-family HTH domain